MARRAAGVQEPLHPYARLWLGPGRAVTLLHCDNRNIQLIQAHDRKHVKRIAPSFLRSVYSDRECDGQVDAGAVDYERFSALRGVPILESTLGPGDGLFIPVGWWHWVKSLDVSISLSLLNLGYN